MNSLDHLLNRQIFMECQRCTIDSDQGTLPALKTFQMGGTQPHRLAVLLQCDDNPNRTTEAMDTHSLHLMRGSQKASQEVSKGSHMPSDLQPTNPSLTNFGSPQSDPASEAGQQLPSPLYRGRGRDRSRGMNVQAPTASLELSRWKTQSHPITYITTSFLT